MNIWQYKGWSQIAVEKYKKGVTSYHLAAGNRTRELVSHPQPRPPQVLRSGTLTFCQLRCSTYYTLLAAFHLFYFFISSYMYIVSSSFDDYFFLKYFLRVLQLSVSSILTPRLPFPRPLHLRKQPVVWEGSTRADQWRGGPVRWLSHFFATYLVGCFVLTILIFQLLACVLLLQSTGAAPQQGYPAQFQQGDKLSFC